MQNENREDELDLAVEKADIKPDITHFDIIHLFGRNTLVEIQRRISKATGLAFITVDYKGEPLTEATSFTKFCATIRAKKETLACCRASDAFGAIQATVSQKPSIYFCPCGLLEVAIPIVVEGHYLGGFIGGQIRCEDAPKEVSRLKNVMGQNLELPAVIEEEKLFEKVPKLSYEQFSNVADLVSLIINQLSEREVSKQMQKESLQKQIDVLKRQKQELTMENKYKSMELASLMDQMNPYFFVNALTSVANLATIESAERTNEMLVLLADYIRVNLNNKKQVQTIAEEMENIERYLQMQKIKLGEKLSYTIQIQEKMALQKIPTRVVLPFVENAIFYGISMKEEPGNVRLAMDYEMEDVILTVEDDGPGLSDAELELRFSSLKGGYEGDSIFTGISNARHKLITMFGRKYDVKIETVSGAGRKITIRYPKFFDERIGENVSDINR